MWGPAVLLCAMASIASATEGGPDFAVVDLSRSPSSALADALRRTDEDGGTAMPAATTKKAVADAAGLGLRCGARDLECLEKLQVLMRVKRLVAFAVRSGTVTITIVGDGAPRTANIPYG